MIIEDNCENFLLYNLHCRNYIYREIGDYQQPGNSLKSSIRSHNRGNYLLSIENNLQLFTASKSLITACNIF